MAQDFSELVKDAIQACADSGVDLKATNARELFIEIEDPELAAQNLEELARTIRLHQSSVEAISV